MSQYLETLYDSVRTVVAATWADVVPNGIFEADHVEMVPYEDLTPPYAIVAIEEMNQVDGYGTANLAYLPPVHIYYVAEVTGPLSDIRGKLEDLRDALHPRLDALAFGQVIRLPSLCWSRALDVNVIMGDKNMAHRAGRLTAEILVGQAVP